MKHTTEKPGKKIYDSHDVLPPFDRDTAARRILTSAQQVKESDKTYAYDLTLRGVRLLLGHLTEF